MASVGLPKAAGPDDTRSPAHGGGSSSGSSEAERVAEEVLDTAEVDESGWEEDEEEDEDEDQLPSLGRAVGRGSPSRCVELAGGAGMHSHGAQVHSARECPARSARLGGIPVQAYAPSLRTSIHARLHMVGCYVSWPGRPLG